MGLLGASGVLGVETLAVEPGALSLCAYVDTVPDAEALRLALAVRLAGAEVEVRPVPDARWAERYQASLRPFPIGTRFLVCPSGSTGTADGRIAIALVPGRAFGTGEHPTTRLCLEGLERAMEAGSRWLDLGTGSGLLSVAASRLGASRVDARDVDPEAVEVAAETFVRNGLDASVRAEVGSTEELGDGAYDGVVANIATSFFVTGGAREIARVLAPGGILLAAGLLVEDDAQVSGSLAAAGLRVVGRHDDAGWRLLVASR